MSLESAQCNPKLVATCASLHDLGLAQAKPRWDSAWIQTWFSCRLPSRELPGSREAVGSRKQIGKEGKKQFTKSPEPAAVPHAERTCLFSRQQHTCSRHREQPLAYHSFLASRVRDPSHSALVMTQELLFWGGGMK